MNDFTASNGAIVRQHPGAAGVRRSVEDLDPVQVPGLTKPDRVQTYFDPRQWDAIAEAVQAEADKRLGRWRWPENPDYVVYLRENGSVTVFEESMPTAALTFWKNLGATGTSSGKYMAAARAYFDAHPEPKPWHNAKLGEVWELTLEGEEPAAFYPSKSLDRHFTPVMPNTGTTAINFDWPEIAAGCRIWPKASK